MVQNQQASDFYSASLNARNIRHLPKLIGGQAKHHHSTFSGSMTKLQQDFLAASKPTAHIELIYHKSMGTDPIGYLAFNETVTEKGKGLYLEDIYILDTVRAQVKGAGSFGFSVLIDRALRKNMDYIDWAVAENNEAATFLFYERKVGGTRHQKVLYDLEDVLQNGTSQHPNLSNSGLTVEKAKPKDLKDRGIIRSIRQFNKRARNPINSGFLASVKDAIRHHNADVYLCRDQQNNITGITFSNINYSTFRTVKGIKAEPMIALTDDAQLYQQSLFATAAKIYDDAYADGTTGHIIWCARANDSLAHSFMATQNAEVLQMEANNLASALVMYGIKDQNISKAKRDSLIPKMP